MREHYDFSKARRGAVVPTDSKARTMDRREEIPLDDTDAEDIAAFEERAEEPTISYEELLKELKRDRDNGRKQ